MECRIALMTLVMTTMFPVVSRAQDSIRDDLQDAERSPLFQKKIPSDQISASGLDRVQLHSGVELEFKRYTSLTRLDQSEDFKPLMTAAIVNGYLRSAPGYTENVLQLQDRLIVSASACASHSRFRSNPMPAMVSGERRYSRAR